MADICQNSTSAWAAVSSWARPRPCLAAGMCHGWCLHTLYTVHCTLHMNAGDDGAEDCGRSGVVVHRPGSVTGDIHFQRITVILHMFNIIFVTILDHAILFLSVVCGVAKAGELETVQ